MMKNKFNLIKTKFRGQRCHVDGELIGQWVKGDLIRKSSRFGGSYHYIYVDGEDLEDESKEYLVDASTIELIIGEEIFKQNNED